MTTLVSIDGQLHDAEHARVSVFDRGFLYGDSVFETVRTYGGRPFELDEHLRRLERSARRVHIELPVSLQRLAEEIDEVLSAAGNSESYLRVMVTRGQGPLGLDPTAARLPLRVIIVGALQAPPPDAYRDGVAVITLKTQRVTDGSGAAGAKVGNYLVSVLAMQQARDRGAVEALIVDGNDCVVEGGSSNVFAVIEGMLCTPPVDAGILPGITRARILEAAGRCGVPVRERELPLVELLGAEEVFVSSSIRELLPVIRVDETPIGSRKPGMVTRRLHQAFLEKVNEDMGL